MQTVCMSVKPVTSGIEPVFYLLTYLGHDESAPSNWISVIFSSCPTQDMYKKCCVQMCLVLWSSSLQDFLKRKRTKSKLWLKQQ